ncbi:MAG: ATP-dependent helicase [Segetibacter sp.]|nr:ATP-dependent helicase [Segetibacter sp.]
MELTGEQYKIVQSTGNIKINAVAGSGKTTTIIEYAKARPGNSRILYLAFNRTVKLEAQKKFAEKGMTNVKVETAHSLAYKHIVFAHRYTVRKQEYRSYEIAEILGITGTGEKHAEYIIANHISKFIAFFCNSDKLRVQDLNYLDVVTDPKARTFVKNYYPYIENLSRVCLAKMDKGEIEITHDFYLKKFQLSNPQLYYDYILFDEGQDASSAMLDVFLKQKATKVIVGDTHQQIYAWRYAVNSLEKIDFPTYHLSTSFRFSQNIANLAREILQWKSHLGKHTEVKISGFGKSEEKKSKAVIGRTNLGLLLKAIAYVTERKSLQHIYFEGNINSYTYADDGASLYDVLNLHNGKRDLIKDTLIKGMNNMAELEDYIEKTEDVQLGMMVEIVNEYGNEIPAIIKSIKDRHVKDDEKDKAEIVFSTVHRCKGMEYDIVQLVNDFITEEKLEKLKKEDLSKSKLNEEINLLYVAVTRTKNSIYIPESLMPKDFPACPEILVRKTEAKEEKEEVHDHYQPYYGAKLVKGDIKKKYNQYDKQQESREPYKPWLPDDDLELEAMFKVGMSVFELAQYFERTNGAIRSRLKKLQLLPAKPAK